MMDYISKSVARIHKDICIPGDKSISHRALLFASIAEGQSHIQGFLPGSDSLATLAIMRALGVTIEQVSETELVVTGVGLHGLQAPSRDLDCANSGTAMRLLAGLLAGQTFDSVLTGDAYLLRRPMHRVVQPLIQMGAKIQAQNKGTAPLHISGDQLLTGISYQLPMASAQVKSCLLIAGLYAQGQTTIIEPAVTRDHTERMLQSMHCPIIINQFDDDSMRTSISVEGGHKLTACDITIPGDISSAAFFMVLAAIHPDACITIRGVGVNPTRTGVIHILELMGADIKIENQRFESAEPVADITVRSSALQGIEISDDLVPLAIDEFPVLMIAASCAQGKTILRGAQELRVKESDRIHTMATGLTAVGIDVEVFDDGMIVTGGTLQGGSVDSMGDHRIAMAFVIAGQVATAPIMVRDCKNIDTSFPSFFSLLDLKA